MVRMCSKNRVRGPFASRACCQRVSRQSLAVRRAKANGFMAAKISARYFFPCPKLCARLMEGSEPCDVFVENPAEIGWSCGEARF